MERETFLILSIVVTIVKVEISFSQLSFVSLRVEN